MQRARRLGAIVDIAARGPVRWRLPAFPWFGGSGPIAWRQLTNALRNSAGILRLLLLMFATVGPILIAALIRGNPAGFLSGALTWLIVFVPLMFRFDFRSDLSHMDWLKMMPLRPIAIALGEMAPPVLLTSLVQVMLVSLLALVMPDARTLLSVAALFTLPFNALLFSVENFLFLLFPAPFGAGAPGSFQFFGRQVALLFTKFLLLAPCCAVASVLGAVGFLICGEVWMVFGIVSWLVVALEAGLVVLGVAWCYRRFDLSLNMPIT
jgi:hypothetical protein